MVSSQNKTQDITNELEDIAGQLTKVNEWIELYNHQLNGMQKYVSEIDVENSSLKLETSNRVKLATLSLNIIVVFQIRLFFFFSKYSQIFISQEFPFSHFLFPSKFFLIIFLALFWICRKRLKSLRRSKML